MHDNEFNLHNFPLLFTFLSLSRISIFLGRESLDRDEVGVDSSSTLVIKEEEDESMEETPLHARGVEESCHSNVHDLVQVLRRLHIRPDRRSQGTYLAVKLIVSWNSNCLLHFSDRCHSDLKFLEVPSQGEHALLVRQHNQIANSDWAPMASI